MTDARPAPVRRQDRIETLDLLRGLGVLGILAVNATGFAAPPATLFDPTLWPFPNEGLSAQLYWVMQTVFQGKFVTLFTMLFGVSIFLVGGEREDDDRGKLLRSRLFWLFLIGVLHGAVVWYGDILTYYAVIGCVFLLMRSLSARTLLIVAAAMLVVGGGAGLGFTAMGQFAVDAGKVSLEQMNQGPVPMDPASVAAALQSYQSGLQGAFGQNLKDWLSLALLMPLVFGWNGIALMSLGLGLFKSGFLKGRAPLWTYGLAIVAGGAALAYVVVSTPVGERQDPLAFSTSLSASVTPLITLAYASALILLARAAGRVLRPLAAVGQMAFTNYLTQSLIMTSIFYGGRGGLMGELDRPTVALIVVGVWALQLVWSPLWLSRFSMGPLEWLWRCLTYGRLVPITRKAEPAGERFVTV